MSSPVTLVARVEDVHIFLKDPVLYILCVCLFVCLFVCVTLVIQCAYLMLRIMLSAVAYPTAPHFSTSSNKRHDFREKTFEHTGCVSIFSKTFV